MSSFTLLREFFSLYSSLSQETSPSSDLHPNKSAKPQPEENPSCNGSRDAPYSSHFSARAIFTSVSSLTVLMLKGTSHVSMARGNETVQSHSVFALFWFLKRMT